MRYLPFFLLFMQVPAQPLSPEILGKVRDRMNMTRMETLGPILFIM